MHKRRESVGEGVCHLSIRLSVNAIKKRCSEIGGVAGEQELSRAVLCFFARGASLAAGSETFPKDLFHFKPTFTLQLLSIAFA